MTGTLGHQLTSGLTSGKCLFVSVVCKMGITVMLILLACCEVRVSYYMKGPREMPAK